MTDCVDYYDHKNSSFFFNSFDLAVLTYLTVQSSAKLKLHGWID